MGDDREHGQLLSVVEEEEDPEGPVDFENSRVNMNLFENGELLIPKDVPLVSEIDKLFADFPANRYLV